MTSERNIKLRRFYGIALSCAIILAGICLMVACVGIYRSGDEPFSREAVAAAFSPIALPVYLCLGMIPAGFVLKLLFPVPAEKVPAVKQHSVILKRLISRADLENCSTELKTQIAAEEKYRKKNNLICALILAGSSVFFLIYALNGSHFHSSQINSSMILAMYRLLPCLAVSLGACIWLVSARKKSMLRQIELLKQCPRLDAPKPESATCCHTNKVRCALLLAAIALAVFGFVTGGTADVLTKAINICTECIGLG